MSTQAELDSASNFELKNLSRKIGGNFYASRRIFDSELEEKFRLLREECTRTLMLMRGLRSSPFYRFASVDTQCDGDAHRRRL